MRAFDLDATLESGQIFRWKRTGTGAWICHGQNVFHVDEQGTCEGANQDWADQFLRSDQGTLEHSHPAVQQALEECRGIRVLRQDPWECLVTFIISQNNNQKRITQNVNDICEVFGEPLRKGFHSFPKPEQLGNEDELRELRLGYRAKHLARLKGIDVDWLYSLAGLEYEDAKKELQKLGGVGPKVADCVLLFSLGFEQACPEDTWIKKFFAKTGLSREDLGRQAGLIQQHMFHAARAGLVPLD